MPYPYEMVIEEFFTGDRIGNRTEKSMLSLGHIQDTIFV